MVFTLAAMYYLQCGSSCDRIVCLFSYAHTHIIACLHSLKSIFSTLSLSMEGDLKVLQLVYVLNKPQRCKM